MTQIQQDHIKRFRKAFPEMQDYSDVEAMAYCRNLKQEKRRVDKFVEKRVNYYGNEAK
jgi:hypothetical protein